MLIPQGWSLKTWSRPRGSRHSVLVAKVSGPVSVTTVTCLTKAKNKCSIDTPWYSRLFTICNLFGKRKTKQSDKNMRNLIQVRKLIREIWLWPSWQIFKSRVSVSSIQVTVSVSAFFLTKSRSRRSESRPHFWLLNNGNPNITVNKDTPLWGCRSMSSLCGQSTQFQFKFEQTSQATWNIVILQSDLKMSKLLWQDSKTLYTWSGCCCTLQKITSKKQ